jgi:hypothetical protein
MSSASSMPGWRCVRRAAVVGVRQRRLLTAWAVCRARTRAQKLQKESQDQYNVSMKEMQSKLEVSAESVPRHA